MHELIDSLDARGIREKKLKERLLELQFKFKDSMKSRPSAAVSVPPCVHMCTLCMYVCIYRRVPKFSPYGSVCCACTQRPGLRTLRSQKT